MDSEWGLLRLDTDVRRAALSRRVGASFMVSLELREKLTKLSSKNLKTQKYHTPSCPRVVVAFSLSVSARRLFWSRTDARSLRWNHWISRNGEARKTRNVTKSENFDSALPAPRSNTTARRVRRHTREGQTRRRASSRIPRASNIRSPFALFRI